MNLGVNRGGALACGAEMPVLHNPAVGMAIQLPVSAAVGDFHRFGSTICRNADENPYLALQALVTQLPRIRRGGAILVIRRGVELTFVRVCHLLIPGCLRWFESRQEPGVCFEKWFFILLQFVQELKFFTNWLGLQVDGG